MEDTLQPRLGELLRTSRRRLGLTQAQVARAIGLVPAVYGRLERGTGLPSLGKLKALCDALELSADTLLALSAPDSRPPSPPPEEPAELRRIMEDLRFASPRVLHAMDRLVRTFLDADRPK
jgi:transcriptional regulator with XRE-family HTH domain